jgi:hypothetical protein
MGTMFLARKVQLKRLRGREVTGTLGFLPLSSLDNFLQG